MGMGIIRIVQKHTNDTNNYKENEQIYTYLHENNQIHHYKRPATHHWDGHRFIIQYKYKQE